MKFLNKLSFLFLFCIIGLNASAQKKDKNWLLVDGVDYNSINPSDKALLDSLLPLYHQAMHDSVRLRILHEIDENCSDENLWPKYNRYLLGLAQEGTEAFYRSYEAAALNNIGFLFDRKGNVKKCIEYYTKALKIREKIGDKEGLAESFNNIASVYSQQGDDISSINTYLKAAKIYKEIGDSSGISLTYNNIASCYNEKGEYEKSIAYNLKALQIQQKQNDLKGISFSYVNLGNDYRGQNRYDTAIQYYKKSLDIRQNLGSRSEISSAMYSLGYTYLNIKDFKQAEKYLSESLKLAQELEFPFETYNAARGLYLLYKETNDFKSALSMYELSENMDDSLTGIEQVRAITATKYKLEVEQQQAENEKKELLAEAEQKKQNLLMLFIICIAIATGIIALIIYKNLQRYKKAKKLIEKQKELVEEKQKEIIDSIRYAKRIQDAVLKEQEHVSAHLPGHFVIFQPKDIVSGDFYWAIEKNNHWYVASADCTGHGVPGAFLTILGTSFLNEINAIDTLLTPAEILDKLRERMISELTGSSNNETKDGMDISLARLNLETKELMWAGANNPLWIITTEENQNPKLIEVTPHKQPIGSFPTLTPYPNHIIQLKKGDIFYLFTDGYADQFGGKNEKKLKYKAIKELLLRNAQATMADQKRILIEYFNAWKGNHEQTDDICMIGINIF